MRYAPLLISSTMRCGMISIRPQSGHASRAHCVWRAGNAAVDGPPQRMGMAAEAAVSPMTMKQSASLGSLIDIGASLSNRREALTVRGFSHEAPHTKGCRGSYSMSFLSAWCLVATKCSSLPKLKRLISSCEVLARVSGKSRYRVALSVGSGDAVIKAPRRRRRQRPAGLGGGRRQRQRHGSGRGGLRGGRGAGHEHDAGGGFAGHAVPAGRVQRQGAGVMSPRCRCMLNTTVL